MTPFCKMPAESCPVEGTHIESHIKIVSMFERMEITPPPILVLASFYKLLQKIILPSVVVQRGLVRIPWFVVNSMAKIFCCRVAQLHNGPCDASFVCDISHFSLSDSIETIGVVSEKRGMLHIRSQHILQQQWNYFELHLVDDNQQFW